MITLGKRYIDTVTGFEGTAIARCDYIDGSSTAQISGVRFNEPMAAATMWINEDQLEVSNTSNTIH